MSDSPFFSASADGNENNYSYIIKHFCEKYNIAAEENSVSSFDILTDELLKFNEHTNLTAVRDKRDVTIKHHADSLALLSGSCLDADGKCYLKNGARVIDVGCGAGFPGLPLKNVRRDIDISFLDSTEKKLKFTSLAADKLGFDAGIIARRAEDAAKDTKLRESFDAAVSRAMANLPVLCELCLPFVKVGGIFAAYKSAKAALPDAESELSRSRNAISQLGGKLENIFYYDLCDFYEGGDEDKCHCLIIIRKIKSTPHDFPRRYPQILKKHL